jgi:formylglycine-generating enzyme required for sulfatase activity
MMIKGLVAILLIMLVIFIGCGEDEPEEVIPKEAEKVKGLPPSGMILISKGEITIDDETISVRPFYLDKYEVTVGQFKKFTVKTGYEYDHWSQVAEYSSTSKHPMVYVSWNDAKAYANWIGKRLPTEVEWEFAARGGLVDQTFPWGDDGDDSSDSVARNYANYNGTGGGDKWEDATAPVGNLKPNGYGLYDMAGNVWEWCQNRHDDLEEYKALRGGSWAYYADLLHVTARNSYLPSHKDNDSGFRCVLVP